MADSGAPLIGSLLSVLTKSQIRYEGVMCNLDIANSTVALQGGECIFHWERGGGERGFGDRRECVGERVEGCAAARRGRCSGPTSDVCVTGHAHHARVLGGGETAFVFAPPWPATCAAPPAPSLPPPPIPRLSHAPPPPHPFPLTQSAPSARRTARRRARPCRPRRRCTTASCSKVKKRGGIGMGGREGRERKKQKATDLLLRLAPPLLSRPPPPPHSPRSPLPSHRRGHRRPGRPEQWPGRAGRAGAAPAAAPARGE